MIRWVISGAVLILGGFLFIFLVTGTGPHPERFSADPVALMSATEAEDTWLRATGIHDFRFPEDFGPHPGFQTEWWYYTGNLQDVNGRHFGYQLTLFRRGVRMESLPRGASAWRTGDIYMAHFAVTDTAEKQFYPFERFVRGAAGLAGASINPFKVWVENWQVSGEWNRSELRASENNVSIDFEVVPQKPEVLQGDRGLSQKGAEKGNASYYFSQTRLNTRGVITIGNEQHTVSGYSWMDREWSTSALSSNQAGWDWFALQLDDGREIMLYQMRLKNGTADRYSSGTLVNIDGSTTTFSAEDFKINALSFWKSPRTRISYPARWMIDIFPAGLSLTVTPFLDDQEHRGAAVYWEGAVNITGDSLAGRGYVELVGYAAVED